MGMATFTEDSSQVDREFAHLKSLFDQIKSDEILESKHQFTELSMGMTGDYQLALKNGSTMVRIGSAIFGARNY